MVFLTKKKFKYLLVQIPFQSFKIVKEILFYIFYV